MGVGPFVPNGDTVFVQPLDIGLAAQEPEQFVKDGFGVDLFGGQQGERSSKRAANLRAKHGVRASAGAVGLEPAFFQDVPQQIEVLNHREENLTTKGTKDTKKKSRRRL